MMTFDKKLTICMYICTIHVHIIQTGAKILANFILSSYCGHVDRTLSTCLPS